MKPFNRIPEGVSKYIIEFYMRHADVLINNTNVRTLEANTMRAVAMKRLIADLEEFFGFHVTEKKIRNHFDHVRAKILLKSGAINCVGAKRKRFLRKNAAHFSVGDLKFPKRIFLTPGEELLMKYYKGLPMEVEVNNDEPVS
ncbi:unnamed protein product [Strongylus vulgaris]|uniref:Uncharacterized protein n=1 Tax=Strongylus vulgaris TaxID=40348 RepID=A0A3P7JV74_STRVU|nr:unnamed protein product [Strongylus vulgaris]